MPHALRLVEPDLATLREYIDWQFFFHAWELKGKFPAILDQPAARELFDDAERLLDRIVDERLLVARGVFGFWPAWSDGDDVVLDEGTRFCFLRQQTDYGDSRPNRSLADYVAAGKESYAVVAAFNLFEYRDEAPLFRRLSERFEACVDGLHLVKREIDARQLPLKPPHGGLM